MFFMAPPYFVLWLNYFSGDSSRNRQRNALAYHYRTIIFFLLSGQTTFFKGLPQ